MNPLLLLRNRDWIFGLLLLAAAKAAGQDERVRIIEADLEKLRRAP
ncbi:MAG: hypothetical protein JW699_06175 [Chitinispirillaceae bacterium]|nr:hypothetical protein [Chitinispirillaceae bacterium]